MHRRCRLPMRNSPSPPRDLEGRPALRALSPELQAQCGNRTDRRQRTSQFPARQYLCAPRRERARVDWGDARAIRGFGRQALPCQRTSSRDLSLRIDRPAAKPAEYSPEQSTFSSRGALLLVRSAVQSVALLLVSRKCQLELLRHTFSECWTELCVLVFLNQIAHLRSWSRRQSRQLGWREGT